ncbi:MAG TPA: ATP-binding cassette domain-containing protein [Treponema sp.]|nr:ATP-binding cassette domain-containing protein [Treponema sp.]
METPVIELRDISLTAQNKNIIGNAQVSIMQGQTVAFVGPSGSGKSTLLKLAGGLIVPTSGEIYYLGNPISTMNRSQNLEFRLRSSFVFQDSALWANQSLRQILELPLKIHFPQMTEKQRTARIVEVCVEAGYKRELDIRPSQLSTGEQKLIAFARAMVCDPEVLFLDEWTESLDESASRRLVKIVKKRQKEGNTIVFVSHNFSVIEELSQRICMIIDGRLSMEISTKDITQNKALAQMVEKGISL